LKPTRNRKERNKNNKVTSMRMIFGSRGHGKKRARICGKALTSLPWLSRDSRLYVQQRRRHLKGISSNLLSNRWRD
jgi:hypothetical protein